MIGLRERQVLEGVAAGKTAVMIAAELHLSPWTIKDYQQRVRGELGARTLAQAVALAYARGLLRLPMTGGPRW